jgi:hypothetical protein
MGVTAVAVGLSTYAMSASADLRIGQAQYYP